MTQGRGFPPGTPQRASEGEKRQFWWPAPKKQALGGRWRPRRGAGGAGGTPGNAAGLSGGRSAASRGTAGRWPLLAGPRSRGPSASAGMRSGRSGRRVSTRSEH